MDSLDEAIARDIERVAGVHGESVVMASNKLGPPPIRNSSINFCLSKHAVHNVKYCIVCLKVANISTLTQKLYQFLFVMRGQQGGAPHLAPVRTRP